ncbi:MAG: putative toxin-antitoxin system toxin component, PIN family [Blastocatellales bacterium]
MIEQPTRVVFDCNIFLQGIANRNSPARKALRLFFDGTISLFVSAEILREVRDVLNRPELRLKLPSINDRIVNALFTKIESQAILIKNVPEEYRLDRDPDDEIYINLAIVTNAQFLVSKDKDLLDLMTATNEDASRFRLRYPF